MNLRHVLHVFRKDGLEILRDRRTLFVNVVLPALLYPFIALFMIQVLQITQTQRVEAPRLALVDADAIQPFLMIGDHIERDHRPAAKHRDAGDDQTRIPVAVVQLPSAAVRAMRAAAVELDGFEQILDRHDLSIAAETRQQQLRREVLQVLRAHDVAAAVIGVPTAQLDQSRLLVVEDDAHVHVDLASRAIEGATRALKHQLVLTRLAHAGLGDSALRPLSLETVDLAPAAEAVRTRLAGMIPLLLVLMAALGAFYPAMDLIAGERERGTLESLLSWPVERRDVFLGKLLVTCAAAAMSVILNLTSLAATAGLAGQQLAAANADLNGAVSVGIGAMALSFVALVPITVTIGAVSLALAGLAASAKEAQNYLSPLLLVVLVAALVAAVPETRSNLVLDLLPITGSVLALKECLQAHELPWLHLAMSTAGSVILAAVVVSWASRLLESERFCYPGLVRAGWGRFRRWGPAAIAPSGLEAMGVYAVAVAGMTFAGSMFQHAGPITMIAAPLLLFILAPALLHCWLGDYRPGLVLQLNRPAATNMWRALAALPFAVMVSTSIGDLQPAAPTGFDNGAEELIGRLQASGLAIELVCVAVLPAVCEELLCRGTLLSGLRRSVGNSGAVIMSSFLFATLHLSPFRFLPQFALGVALALLTMRARSIVPAMVLHGGHNAAVLLLATAAPWIARWLPGADLLGSAPPLALLGIGLLGLWAAICAEPAHFRRTAPLTGAQARNQ